MYNIFHILLNFRALPQLMAARLIAGAIMQNTSLLLTLESTRGLRF